jgi:hypothetical protein
MFLGAVKIAGLLILINIGLIDRYELMNEQQKIEVEQLAQEEREAKEELKRKQVKLERPSEDTNLVNGTSGDVKICVIRKQSATNLRYHGAWKCCDTLYCP